MQGSGGEPDAEYRKMLRALHAAMEGELTRRQRECIQLRYFEQMRVNEIAGLLGAYAGDGIRPYQKGAGAPGGRSCAIHSAAWTPPGNLHRRKIFRAHNTGYLE